MYWFFILCAILVGINFISSLSFFPETNYRLVLYDDATTGEADKQADQMLEHKNIGEDSNDVHVSSAFDLNLEYIDSYWKNLVGFIDRGLENRGILGWPRCSSYPLDLFWSAMSFLRQTRMTCFSLVKYSVQFLRRIQCTK